jgi:hypothetical protein
MLHDAVRSKDEAPTSLRRMLTTIRSLGHTVRRLRVDNNTVFLDVGDICPDGAVNDHPASRAA